MGWFLHDNGLRHEIVNWIALPFVDPCEQPLIRGSCPNIVSNQRYYYEKETNTCKLFLYLGCTGNENKFETRFACESRCVKSKCISVSFQQKIYIFTQVNTQNKFHLLNKSRKSKADLSFAPTMMKTFVEKTKTLTFFRTV